MTLLFCLRFVCLRPFVQLGLCNLVLARSHLTRLFCSQFSEIEAEEQILTTWQCRSTSSSTSSTSTSTASCGKHKVRFHPSLIQYETDTATFARSSAAISRYELNHCNVYFRLRKPRSRKPRSRKEEEEEEDKKEESSLQKRNCGRK